MTAPLSNKSFWEQRFEQCGDFPDHVLVDIARNDAAERRYRLFAVEVLVARKSPKVQHPDLRHLVHELEIELEGIEFVHPAPTGGGPLAASITTESIGYSPEIQNASEVAQLSSGEANPPAPEAKNDLPVPPSNPVPAKTNPAS